MRSRRGIELINRFASDEAAEEGKAGLADRIAPYRAGYTPQQRREIESQLASGELLAVAATDALELGIDVGELDAAICVNFPGTVASLRQMWGRAGRRRRGLAVYVAGEDALDQFFCRHPDEFLERPVEAAILDHRSEQIQMQHLVAAAYESPLGPDDDEILGEGWRERAERLVTMGELRRGRGRALPDPHGRLRRRPDRAALGLGRQRRGRRRLLRRDARQRRGRARLLDRPPRRDLPAPGALLRGRRARRRLAPRDRQAVRGRLLHPGEEGDRGLHRGDRDPAAAPRGRAQLRRRSRSPSR